jgi:predicted metal-dependent phosphotriesterase family hydrolase
MPVQTVRGPVDASALGQTLMHERIFVLTADVQQNYPEERGDGVTGEQIEAMLVTNAARILA